MENNPVEISKSKRIKFFKALYCLFDFILPRNHWPLIGKIASKLRVHFFRKISPSVSKKISIDKGCEVYPFVTIEDNVVIGLNVHFNWCVSIGYGSKIAKDVYFNTQNWVRDSKGVINDISEIKPIVIGKHCWIGTKSVVLGGTLIGDYSTIGAGSVVTKNVPSKVMAAGNPAIIKKQIFVDDNEQLSS